MTEKKIITLIESYTGPGGAVGAVVFQSDYTGLMTELIDYLNGYGGLDFQRPSREGVGEGET